MMKINFCWFFLLSSLAASSWAEPVTYTARAVVSGTLGSHAFSNAVMVITLRGDTRDVQSWESSYPSGIAACCELENHGQAASIAVTQTNGQVLSAHFLPGQIFARYDEVIGVVGFGSSVSPFYPVTVGCYDPPACSDLGYNDGNVDFSKYDGLTSVVADFDYWVGISGFVGSLALGHDNFETLSANALLPGATHTCAGPVTYGSCSVAAPPPLHTDAGDLYLSDLTPSGSIDGNVGVFLVKVGDDQ